MLAFGPALELVHDASDSLHLVHAAGVPGRVGTHEAVGITLLVVAGGALGEPVWLPLAPVPVAAPRRAVAGPAGALDAAAARALALARAPLAPLGPGAVDCERERES